MDYKMCDSEHRPVSSALRGNAILENYAIFKNSCKYLIDMLWCWIFLRKVSRILSCAVFPRVYEIVDYFRWLGLFGESGFVVVTKFNVLD